MAAHLNVIRFILSPFSLWIAAMTTLWVPKAFTYSLAGSPEDAFSFARLALTRWSRLRKRLLHAQSWLVLLLRWP